MLQKMPNGKWKARFRWRTIDKDGITHQHETAKRFQRKGDAERWLLERKQDNLQGKDKTATTYLFLFNRYYNTFKKNHIRHNTQAGWQLSKKAFVDFFGKYKLIDKITRDDWQKFMDDYCKTRSHHTAVGVNQRLVEVLNYAVDE